jgi:hypothetical protein
LANQKQ